MTQPSIAAVLTGDQDMVSSLTKGNYYTFIIGENATVKQ